jgi:hypothetical protein
MQTIQISIVLHGSAIMQLEDRTEIERLTIVNLSEIDCFSVDTSAEGASGSCDPMVWIAPSLISSDSLVAILNFNGTTSVACFGS